MQQSLSLAGEKLSAEVMRILSEESSTGAPTLIERLLSAVLQYAWEYECSVTLIDGGASIHDHLSDQLSTIKVRQ